MTDETEPNDTSQERGPLSYYSVLERAWICRQCHRNIDNCICGVDFSKEFDHAEPGKD